MGAKHVINPNQLTMFERAGDLADSAVTMHGDWDIYYEDFDEFKGRKLRESLQVSRGGSIGTHQPQSLHQSIKEQGVYEPVHVEQAQRSDHRLELQNGHHRAFAQADIDPEAFIPVKWNH